MYCNKNEFKERLNERDYEHYEVNIKKINSKTGEILEEYSKGYRKKQAKKGWCMMYKKDMRQVLKELATYPTAMLVWLELWDNMKKDGTIAMPKQIDLAKKLGKQRQVIGRAIKKLKEEELIEKIGNEWRYNPFIFTISGMSDIERFEAQQIWEKEVGHYVD